MQTATVLATNLKLQVVTPATDANFDGYEVIVEPVMLHTSGELAGLTTYRLYLETGSPR